MPEDEIDLQLVQAELRLKAARQLQETGFYDDAVSRAYYSMYFAATAMFLARGIRVKTHRGLVARFGREFVETGLIEAHFGRILRIAEELRSEADYSIIRQISDEEAAAILNDADKFLARAKDIITNIRSNL
ncbi:MAG: HEPN domain-containing protein [Methanothrix sp.]|uniref:HEPN domain-containing protein n=1 Tax=Methanothrix harundinacea TaxID=301375 RepID=A0A101IK48_9EURY|nr:MAG: hypothetical protein APR56_04120 [Methanosaeta sp. SDB]KUK96558.1 MAG: Uncharacterized protein XE07_1026 [Methanothrix harundinacea]MDD2638354.1 HEPN domain-containing protein [Methanothrix sp.]MDI9399386.1 HEPN domain-containing protein [Euryarchaeota archaeon]MCP1391544.1 HEPN domain-containing protein [Methanothrix harundinacea]